MRWQHPRDGLISPDEFIPLAEQTGLIRPLGLWVLDAALRRCAEWSRAGLDLRVAVNLAADSLQDPRWPRRSPGCCERDGVSPERLTLEMTESAMMADPGRAKEILGRIARRGRAGSIDDFGTGYSSLAYLRTCRSTRSRSTRSSSRGMADVTSRTPASCVRSSSWGTTSACGSWPKGWRTGRPRTSWPRGAVTSRKVTSLAGRCHLPTCVPGWGREEEGSKP